MVLATKEMAAKANTKKATNETSNQFLQLGMMDSFDDGPYQLLSSTLHYLVETKDTSIDTLVGHRVTNVIYIGTIPDTWIDEDHVHYLTVTYDDHDLEDLDFAGITAALEFFKIYSNEFRFRDTPESFSCLFFQ